MDSIQTKHVAPGYLGKTDPAFVSMKGRTLADLEQSIKRRDPQSDESKSFAAQAKSWPQERQHQFQALIKKSIDDYIAQTRVSDVDVGTFMLVLDDLGKKDQEKIAEEYDIRVQYLGGDKYVAELWEDGLAVYSEKNVPNHERKAVAAERYAMARKSIEDGEQERYTKMLALLYTVENDGSITFHDPFQPMFDFVMTVPSANEADMADSQPFYTAKIDARNVAYELLVNGIPVLDKRNEFASINSKFPLNPWLIDGRNTFTIRILPVEPSEVDPNDAKYCRVFISGPKAKGMPDATIAQAEMKPSASAPAPSKDGSFTVSLGHLAPAWAHSEKIGRDATTQKKILDKYREFHRLLERKNLDGIMKFSAAKFKDYSKSMYDPDFESNKKDSFKEQFASPGELIGIDVQEKNGLRYEYYYDDRLVSIKNDEDRSIIQYYDADEGVTTQYALFFYFDGKDFVLIL